RPSATFAAPPKTAAPKPAPTRPAAAPAAAPEAPRPPAKPKGPVWAFEGVVYDVISLQAVFAAHLRFLDASGETVGQTTTGDGGRYRVALPPLASGAYTLTVSHPDYSDKYIDEIDPPFREVDREQRLLLSESAARNRPWQGDAKKSLRRDFVMIPRSPEEP
ncbi:MAG: carboxypeptidase-like regulatory domain-containing protein, partial [Elusimicrobiota bacterium]|nr:carboxypeptidase-like regulatory domain-containing protein [Elusimicrobiota bacterium]